MSRFRVCLVLEGSYPFITGGVGSWVHELISSLSEVDFALFTISPEADQPLRYVLPPNVTEHRDIVLTSPPEEFPRHPDLAGLASSVTHSHQQAFRGAAFDLKNTIQNLPEGYALHRDALSREDLWRLIVDRNTEKNPLYPFSDYLWSWRSSHDMMFRLLALAPPEADLYHAISTGFAGLAALAAKWRRNKPMLLTEHGLYHKERDMEIRKATFLKGYQRDHWTSLYQQLSRVCYREADQVTSLFEANRQEQIRLGADPDRAVVIPNGIDLARFSSVVRQPRPGYHIGLVGRVVPIKDIKTFIVTAKILAASLDDVRFYCVGPTDEDAAYAQECVELVESLGLSDRFTFTGRQNVLEYYAFFDLLVLTSVREAQPLSILEAWCARVPVVATRVGNVPEMLDYDDRFLVDSKDAEALARKILWLRHHPLETEKAVGAFQRKATRFHDRDAVFRSYRALYQGLGGASWPE